MKKYYHVRLKTRFANFKMADGTMSREHDFITDVDDCGSEFQNRVNACTKAIMTIWPDPGVASLYLEPRNGIEIWPANRLRASAR